MLAISCMETPKRTNTPYPSFRYHLSYQQTYFDALNLPSYNSILFPTGNGITEMNIGANDYELDTVWEWVTGRCSFGVYSNWADNRPNNGDENEYCLMMRSDGKWNDVPCHESRHYFCQF